MSENKQISLSASLIQTLEKCSWLYYCKYILRLPDKSNDGAKRGSCCHALFECLLNKRHKKTFDYILKAKTITTSPNVLKFIRKQMKKQGLGEIDTKGNDNFKLIDEMILVGLKNDFFVKGAKLEKAETKFDYSNENPSYRIKGYIDKIAVRGSIGEIYDYKSSEKKYEGDEKDNNIQSLIYNLWYYKTRKLMSKLKFIFLRFPKDPIQEHKHSEEELNGFEVQLSILSDYLKGFDRKKGTSNMAAHQNYQKGFRGPLVCGKASFPGQLKKDGDLMYYCPFKFSFDYFGLYNKENVLIKTAFNKKDLKPKENEQIINLYYSGCPAHKKETCLL